MKSSETHFGCEMQSRKRRYVLVGLAMLAGMVVLATGSSAEADFVTYTEDFGFPMSASSEDTVYLPQFDTLNDTRELQYVVLHIVASQSAHVTAENKSPEPGLMGLSLTGNVTVTGSNLSVIALTNVSIAPVEVAPWDGISGTGDDFIDFGYIEKSNSDQDRLIAGLDPLDSFIGTGSLEFLVEASGGFLVTGVTDSTMNIRDLAAAGSVSVTYGFETVPEPATMILLGAGGIAALVRRRRRG